MADRDPRLDLIMAYREAGLNEKADELTAEVLREQGLANPGEIKAKLDAARADLDAAVDKLAKLGFPLTKHPRSTKRRKR